MRKIFRVFYPLLFGIYFALELVGFNISQMYLSAGLRVILFTIVFCLGVYALFSWRIRDEHKAALLCGWFFLMFFSYGHVYDAIEGWNAFGFVLGRHRFLFPLWVLLFSLGGWWLYTRQWKFAALSRILNATMLVLIAIPVVQIAAFELGRSNTPPGTVAGITPATTGQAVSSQPLPDIYYIILDGYPRQDMLLQYHDFDNSAFSRDLEALGFYVAPCSQSNYAMTTLSLLSSLNMDYLEGLAENIGDINVTDSIFQSETLIRLQGLGYQTVSFESGVWFTEFRQADTFISQDKPILTSFFDLSHLSAFEVLFVRTTILRVVEESKTAWLDTLFENPRREIYDRLMFEFDQLEGAAALPGPKFVFVHIMAPHSTGLIFDAEGAFAVSEIVDPALGNELLYINQRIVAAAEAILAGSTTPPIIIIQSDHGLDPENRMANLSAFYFPAGGTQVLYPTITPVNIFRLVFNTYLGGQFPLLPDVSYYSTYEDPYIFNEVLYPCQP